MFNFEEVEQKTIRQLEDRIFELDNMVRHWKTMYEMEIKKRPVIVKYENGTESTKRLRQILQLHHDSNDIRLKNILIENLYMDYGITKEPSNELVEWWQKQND